VPPRPALVVLDVNETLSDLAPLAGAFERIGLGAAAAEPWFASVLRDGFALTVLGENPGFAALGKDEVRGRLRATGAGAAPEALDAAADEVIGAFLDLRPHPDVVPGLRTLAGAGIRVATLSNGSAAVARRLLAGADDVVEAYLSVEDAGVWKPAAAAYAWALDRCGVAPADALMVAVHPWDLEGAHRAGLRTAWLDRRGTGWPGTFTAPDLTATTMTGLATELGA
jgi:2-haloacid dehalogenase